MPYVVYHTETTKRLDRVLSRFGQMPESYATMGAAKAALTRAEKKDDSMKGEFSIAEFSVFYCEIEKQVTKTALFGGHEFTQGVNTPNYCDPSTETYWSM